jgi:hypothetical protein
MERWSRGELKGTNWRFAGAILPSAVIATLIHTEGKLPRFILPVPK